VNEKFISYVINIVPLAVGKVAAFPTLSPDRQCSLSLGLVTLDERCVDNFTYDGAQTVIVLSRQEAWHSLQEVLELRNGKGVMKEGKSIMG